MLLIFCPAESKSFVGDYVCVSKNFGYRKFFWTREEGVYHDFLLKSLSHSTENFHRGTPLCFRKLRVPKNCMHRNGISLNSIENFCLKAPKNFMRKHFVFRKVLVSQFFFDKRRRGLSRFFFRNFCLTLPKIFVGEPFCVSEKSGTEKS